ncbi:MAG: hypothetical protein GYB67_02190, partial [Chloroflexi bacterium]|nr:hypothetical protein [Chloroflexota bacterium]
VVRVTDSGLGCGNDWPLCDGQIIPPLDNVTAWIEWSHRLFAVLIGLFGLATLYVAIRAYRQRNRVVLGATVLAAVLFMVQSGLGAFVVIFELPPTMVTLHLGTAMLLLGALLIAAIGARYVPRQFYKPDSFTILVYVTTALSLVIILTGALVRGSGATLACVDWPLCNGEILPFQQGQLATIHMLHRFAVAGLGIALALLIASAFTTRTDRRLRILALLSLAVYLTQALVGALFVWSAAAPVWGATHVGMAALTWALLVALSVYETLNHRAIDESETEKLEQEWQPQSEPLLN